MGSVTDESDTESSTFIPTSFKQVTGYQSTSSIPFSSSNNNESSVSNQNNSAFSPLATGSGKGKDNNDLQTILTSSEHPTISTNKMVTKVPHSTLQPSIKE